MTQQKRGLGVPPPKFVGVKPGKDPVVAKYTQGIVERAQANAEKNRVKIPDLAAASAQYRPGKDGPMTLSAIASAQEKIIAMNSPENPEKASLRPETVAGLRALHDATAAQQGPPPETATPPPSPPAVGGQSAASAPAKPEDKDKKSFTRLSEDERRQAAETSDIDFDLMMQRLRNDILNNEDERKAIEKELKEMDLSDGLMTGEFRQFVPIKKGKLEVMFRSVSPMENNEIRQRILEEVIADERQSSMASEKLGFWQMVASIHSLNGQEMPKHTGPAEKGQAGRVFLWPVFTQKVNLYSSYPIPLIHSLSTHAYWFDLRVRRLFTSAALKNG